MNYQIELVSYTYDISNHLEKMQDLTELAEQADTLTIWYTRIPGPLLYCNICLDQ